MKRDKAQQVRSVIRPKKTAGFIFYINIAKIMDYSSFLRRKIHGIAENQAYNLATRTY